MRRLRILKYIISVLLLAFLTPAMAQQKGSGNTKAVPAVADTVKAPRHKYPLFNGVIVGVNIADPILRLFGQDYGGYEAMVEVNLHNRFLPIWSIGVGSAKRTTDTGLFYETKPSIYNRVGMNYNFRFNNESPNYFVAGLMYGFSSYKADIRNMSYNDGYWPEISPIEIPEQKFVSHWLEISFGIRVQVVRNFYMGWNVQYKPLLKEGSTSLANPWYIPGYGVGGFGFNYNLMYQIPARRNKSNKKAAPSAL